MLGSYFSTSISGCSTLLRPHKVCLTDGIMDWMKFHEIIVQIVNLKTRLKCLNDIENAVLNLTNTIQSAAWSCSTKKTFKV